MTVPKDLAFKTMALEDLVRGYRATHPDEILHIFTTEPIEDLGLGAFTSQAVRCGEPWEGAAVVVHRELQIVGGWRCGCGDADWDFTGFWGLAARRKSPWLPAAVRFNALDGTDESIAGTKVIGYQIVGTVTRGPRKGKPKYGARLPPIVVTDQEFEQEQDIFERTSGRCCECMGTGQICCGASVEGGSSFRECKRCGGSGNAPQEVSRG